MEALLVNTAKKLHSLPMALAENESYLYIVAALVSVGVYMILTKVLTDKRSSQSRLPPGPPPLPIIGNLLLFRTNPHESLTRLVTEYGPLVSLKLGQKTAVVASSSAIAREILQTHDLVCSGRPPPFANEALQHCHKGIVFNQYGPYWRMLRRISTTLLFSPSTLQSLQPLRQAQVHRMLRGIFKNGSNEPFHVWKNVFGCALNLLANAVFGMDAFDPNSTELDELKETIEHIFILHSSVSLADVFPVLRCVDPQGIKRKTASQFRKLYKILGDLLQRCGHQHVVKELLATTNESFTLDHVICYLTDLFLAASDTMPTTVEWAMTELLRNPEKMRRVREEVKRVVGEERCVEEEEAGKMEYVNAVIKETLRVHPPGPLLLHRTDAEVEVGGYVVPKHATVFVNVWALGRDPTRWRDAEVFQPERWLAESSGVEFKGRDSDYIPFGAGRRICPGLSMAARTLPFLLASLLHSFDFWAADENMVTDISGRFATTLVKAVSLQLLPSPRLSHSIYESLPK